MNSPPSQLPPNIDYQPPQPKQGLSTGAKWGIGCGSGCLVLLLIAGILGYMVWVKARDFASGVLDEFTSDAPIAFGAPEAPVDEIEAVVARFDAFRDAMKEGKEAEPLSLSGRDINLLIYHHPDWKEMAGHTSIEIEGEQLSGQVSLPLEELSPMLKGRYLNGKATVRIELQDGHLEGYIDGIEVAEKQAPPEFIAELQAENIFKDQQQDPEMKQLIEDLELLKIEGGKLIIVPKSAAERKASDEKSDSSPTPVPAEAVEAAQPVEA